MVLYYFDTHIFDLFVTHFNLFDLFLDIFDHICVLKISVACATLIALTHMSVACATLIALTHMSVACATLMLMCDGKVDGQGVGKEMVC